MGIKLEYILILIIAVTVFATTTVKLTSNTKKSQGFTKELEFIDTTFIEVDTQKMQSKLYTPLGIRNNGLLTLNKLNYYTPTIESLLADTGTYKDNILHLDGHVSLRETTGNLYKTEHAIYDQKKEILTITSPFVSYMDKNIFKGATLIYNAITKEANATMVDAFASFVMAL